MWTASILYKYDVTMNTGEAAGALRSLSHIDNLQIIKQKVMERLLDLNEHHFIRLIERSGFFKNLSLSGSWGEATQDDKWDVFRDISIPCLPGLEEEYLDHFVTAVQILTECINVNTLVQLPLQYTLMFEIIDYIDSDYLLQCVLEHVLPNSIVVQVMTYAVNRFTLQHEIPKGIFAHIQKRFAIDSS